MISVLGWTTSCCHRCGIWPFVFYPRYFSTATSTTDSWRTRVGQIRTKRNLHVIHLDILVILESYKHELAVLFSLFVRCFYRSTSKRSLGCFFSDQFCGYDHGYQSRHHICDVTTEPWKYFTSQVSIQAINRHSTSISIHFSLLRLSSLSFRSTLYIL